MTFLRRIGGSNAISSWSYWLTLGVFLVATLLPSSRDQFTGSAAQRLTLALAGTLAAFVVLLVARATVLGPGPRRARPVVAKLVFALAGAVQGGIISAIRPAFDLPFLNPTVLIITRALAGVLWLSVLAVLVDEVRTHHARMALLRGRLESVSAALDEERAGLRATWARLRGETLGPLNAALGEVRAQLAALGDAAAAEEQAGELRRLVDEDVRPLSHDLLQREVFAAEPAGPPPGLSSRERLRAIVRLAASSLAAPTWVAVLLPMAFVLLFAVQDIGVAFITLVSASYVAITWALFAVLRPPLDHWLPRLSTGRSVTVVLLVYEALAMVAVVNNWAWGDLSTIGRWVEWPTLFTLPAIWVGIAVTRAAQAERERDERELERALAEYRLITARGRQRLRHEYQSLGRLLHGNVQASLLAISRRLDMAGAAPGPERQAALDAAAHDLQVLGDRIASPQGADWHASEALDDVLGMWSGLIDVRLECPDGLIARLDSVPATRMTVVDVIAEGITNAVRHGLASSVIISLVVSDPARIDIIIADDGRGDVGGDAGMGSRLFDSVAAEWTRATGGTGCIVRVVVPMDAGA